MPLPKHCRGCFRISNDANAWFGSRGLFPSLLPSGKKINRFQHHVGIGITIGIGFSSDRDSDRDSDRSGCGETDAIPIAESIFFWNFLSAGSGSLEMPDSAPSCAPLLISIALFTRFQSSSLSFSSAIFFSISSCVRALSVASF